jgi:Spy/CpxP family protein refolding chaperone
MGVLANRGWKGRYIVKKGMAILWLALASAAVGFAQADLVPPGKWWRQPRLVEELALTDEQQSRLDAAFQNSAAELIDLKAEVEKRGLALRQQIDQAQVNRQELQRAAANLSQARARLFERELMMFIDMRSVLSPDQWRRMQGVLAAQKAMRRDQRMRNQRMPGRGLRPGGPGRRPGQRPTPQPNPPRP